MKRKNLKRAILNKNKTEHDDYEKEKLGKDNYGRHI